jgi:hypothetical protein
MRDHKTGLDKLNDKLHNKYIGIGPMLLIGSIAIIIIYYYIFSSLGNNDNGSASDVKVFFETILWLLFIVLLLLNGISYIFGIDLMKTFDLNFGSERGNFDDEGQELKERGDDDTDTSDDEDDEPKIMLKEQVFHLPENKYNYEDAKAICKAYGSRMATYDDMSKAYNKGADWCTYGWSDDQMALFPTQEEKWERLQKMKGHEQDCGRPGINGGYIYDAEMKYGANCFGAKKPISDRDVKRMRQKPEIRKTKKELEFEDRVKYWKSKTKEITMSPFNHDNWSMF